MVAPLDHHEVHSTVREVAVGDEPALGLVGSAWQDTTIDISNYHIMQMEGIEIVLTLVGPAWRDDDVDRRVLALDDRPTLLIVVSASAAEGEEGLHGIACT